MGRAILSNLKEGVAISNSVKRSSEKTEVATYGGRRRVEVVGMWSEPRRGRWLADSWPSVGECARFGFLVGLGVFGGVMVVESDEVGDERAAASRWWVCTGRWVVCERGDARN